jgi:hypothetical protein
MRKVWIGFAAVFAAGLAALAAVGLTEGSSLVYTPGVNPVTPVAVLGPDDQACQGPISVPDGTDFDRVGLTIGTYRQPGQPIRVNIVAVPRGRVEASGHAAGGYGDVRPGRELVVPVGRVETEAPIRVCVTNEGDRKLALFGQAGIASPHTSGRLNGQPLKSDVALALRHDERSLLALAPDIARRASRFRAGWVGPVVYLVLALAILAGAPLLLARGIARAGAEDRA